MTEEKLKSWKYSSLDTDDVLADLDQMVKQVSGLEVTLAVQLLL